jgi:exonuclease III
MSNKRTNELKITHWNCNGIRNKATELGYFLKESKPDIVSLNEIKVNNSTARRILDFEGYFPIFKCRKVSSNHGGGVALLIKNNIIFKLNNQLDEFDLETVAVSVKFNQVEILLISYYNPPQQSPDARIWDKLEELKLPYIICGDLNSRTTSIGCRGDNDNGAILENIIIDHPTYLVNDDTATFKRTINSHTNNQIYEELLDLFLCSLDIIPKIKTFKVLDNDFLNSDHFPIEIELNVERPSSSHTLETGLDFNRANWNCFQNKLDAIAIENSNLLSKSHNVESLSHFIDDSIKAAASISIPKRKKIGSSVRLPKYVIDLIKTRRELKKAIFNYKQVHLKPEYNSINKKVKREIEKIRSDQWLKFLEKCGKSPTSSIAYWNRINRVNSNKNSSKMYPTLINDAALMI